MKRKERKRLLFLAVLAALLVASITAIWLSGQVQPRAEYDVMTDAARRFEAAAAAIRSQKSALGIPMEKEDILQIGLLGTEVSPITTTSGDLSAKRTSQTSDMAALCVRLLTDAGVKPGDKIGACMSGSFPGLNIALLCACDAMGVDVVYTASVGASSYGANTSQFTSPEMLVLLWEKGLISTLPASISAGGAEDSGSNMFGHAFDETAVIEQTLARVRALDVPFACIPDLAQNVAHHVALYGDIDCFVNVGGALVGLGAGETVLSLGQGVLKKQNIDYQEKSGLLEYYLAQDVPTIHLLNVKQICLEYGVVFDPTTKPEVGATAVYYGKSYPRWALLLVGTLSTASLLVFAWAKTKKKQ